MRLRGAVVTTLGLHKNPLLRPPTTVMAMGVDQAIAWWEDIGRFGEGTSNKLKMVLVGLAEAGKTTVVRNITDKPSLRTLDRTVGIEITDGWKPVDDGPLEISIWDFAGQADYFASHQIFLTKGCLFLLVVDLRELFLEAVSGVKKGGDPHGRVYRWLEMLHFRVPEAAVALVGTHTDAAEFQNPANLGEAVNRLEQLISRYNEDKKREAANIEAVYERARAPDEELGTMDREVLVGPQLSPPTAAGPPVIHDRVFQTSLDRDSTKELVEWVGKAATLLDCPAGFHFPAVRAKIPTAWIHASSAMGGLCAGESGKRYVTWREAVQTFGYFMEANGTPIPDAEEVLLRAMRHREAEGGVLLSLEDSSAGVRELTGMLYLDPTWLIELVRRLTDHNLVDAANQGTIKDELEKYGEEHNPRLRLDALWQQHMSYRTSGTLDLAYLRFLWLHRRLGANGLNDEANAGLQLNLDLDEFNSVLVTMEALLVMYRAHTTEGTARALYVVPARLPEYGDERVLEKGNIALGDAVVWTSCSFRRSYAPPGLIGRFLAFSNAHIKEARECWQHGAHLIWTPGSHDVLVYEAQTVETSGNDSVAYPKLVLCVKGSTPVARDVLDSLTGEVKRLLEDEVHGYPGICSVFEGTATTHVSNLTGDLRKYLDNRFEQLSATIRKVAEVTSEVLQACYLAAEEENQYPRLVILKPETNPRLKAEVRNSPTPGSSPMVCYTGQEEVNDPAVAAAEGMQRETWNRWIDAFTEGRKVRMVFICEHDMTEVRCGPDGKGYLIKDLPNWAKGCLPILKVSLLALRVAVGTVSHVDLPFDALLAAVVKSASTELLGAMGTGVSGSGLTEASPLRSESTGGEQQQQERLQKEGYEALCRFMQTVESPSSKCCGPRSQCSICGASRRNGCSCVSWRAEMVRVPNGKGGLVWVKRTNEIVYTEKIAREAERPRSCPRA